MERMRSAAADRGMRAGLDIGDPARALGFSVMTNQFQNFFFRPLKPRSLASRVLSHLRQKLIAGLVTITPISITIFVSVWIFRAIVQSDWLLHTATFTRIPDRNFAIAVAFTVTLAFVYVVGVVSTTFMVRQLIGLAERILVHIPVVKLFYVTSKQIMDTLNQPPGSTGRKVVVVEYPRKECYSIGFATGESLVQGELFVHVFVLTTPNPTSGWLLLLRAVEVWETNYTGEEAMKLILSGGIVGKPELALRPYIPGHGTAANPPAGPRKAETSTDISA